MVNLPCDRNPNHTVAKVIVMIVILMIAIVIVIVIVIVVVVVVESTIVWLEKAIFAHSRIRPADPKSAPRSSGGKQADPKPNNNKY